MADHSITISNRIGTFGPSRSTKWNEFSWGNAKWGEGTLPWVVSVGKVVSNSISPTTTLKFSVFHLMSLGSITPTLNFNKSVARTVSIGSVTLDTDVTEAYVTDQAGYYFIFVRPTTDGENQVITTYTQFSGSEATYTSSTVTSTTWS